MDCRKPRHHAARSVSVGKSAVPAGGAPMTRRSRIWLVAAALFVLINLGGAVYAVVMGELVPHATLHLVLLIPGVYVLSRLLRRRDASGDWREESIPTQPGA